MQSWNPSVKGVTHNWKGSNCFGSNIGTMVFVFAFVCILLNVYVFVIDHHVYQYIKVMYYTAHITNLYLFLYLYFVFGHDWSSCISLTPRLRLALPKGFERSPIADPSFLNAPCNQDLPFAHCNLIIIILHSSTSKFSSGLYSSHFILRLSLGREQHFLVTLTITNHFE